METSRSEPVLKIKKVYPDAILPKRFSVDDAGLDLFSYESQPLHPNETRLISTGIAMEIPPGHYGRVAPRSGISLDRIFVNAGVIDRGYRGEVKVMLHNCGTQSYPILKGTRIAQLILEKISIPVVQEVQELGATDRGDKGFGSTGK